MVAAAACAVAVLAKLVFPFSAAPATLSTEAVDGGFTRYGRCLYHFRWPSLGAVGDLITRAHIRMEAPERAWERWLASHKAGLEIGPKMGLGRRFNGTREGFQALWDMRQCPPGPCGPDGLSLIHI